MRGRDVSIQIIRVLSMFAIILCHLVQELNSTAIAKTGQFFNVGVYIFLFLSGWLYGKKKISNIKEWISARVEKILLPMWMFMPFLFLMHTLQGTMKWKYIPIFLIDAQYWFEGLIGGAHLWFVSIIFLCYLILPFLQKSNKVWVVIVSTLIVGGGLCYLSRTLGMAVLYVTIFIIGYTFRNYDINIQWTTAAAWVIVALVIRLVSMKLFDGTILYDCLLVYLTHTALTIGLIFFGKQLCRANPNEVIDWFDDISYFVYITHYMFMTGPIRTMGLTKSIFLNIAITIVLTFSSALLLQRIYNRVVQIK